MPNIFFWESINSFMWVPFYGNNLVNASKAVEMAGIDIEMTITFPPKSILFAILLSPLSLQTLTAYSVKMEIPVIFSKIEINAPPELLLKVLMNSIIPISVSRHRYKIIAPPINTANMA